MHQILKYISLLVLLLFIGACTSNKFENFDDKSWKEDRNGCTGKRRALVATILARKAEIYGLNEVEILHSFGRPDVNDLRRRQQKFYYYYTENATSCAGDSSTRTLKFRFNAIDKVQEILYE